MVFVGTLTIESRTFRPVRDIAILAGRRKANESGIDRLITDTSWGC